MSEKNERYTDNSIHHVNGIIVNDRSIVKEIKVIQPGGKSSSYDWKKMQEEFESSLAKIGDINVKAQYVELGTALREKNESKLIVCAKKLGEFGIGLLTSFGANVLSEILLKILGL